MSLDIKEMLAMQTALQEKYRASWGGLYPEKGRSQLLWAMIEMGEAADHIKKAGDDAIMEDAQVRHDFIEEMCDTFMYLYDTLLCYGVTPEEAENIYREKNKRNLHRW